MLALTSDADAGADQLVVGHAIAGNTHGCHLIAEELVVRPKRAA
jgi:hypothetical protein